MSWREGRERHQRSSQLLSISVKGLAARCVAGAIPHSDAASQNALDLASVEGAHDGGRALALLVCGGSRDTVVLSWLVLQCCWSRRGHL